MSFRFIFYSDTHLGFDFPLTRKSKRVRRGIDFFDNFHRIYQYALDNNINTLVHGGDLFYRSKIPDKLVNHVYLILHEYAARGVKTYIVPGNHERSRLPASLIMQDPNICVFTKPQNYVIESPLGRICFCGFPFETGDIRSKFNDLISATNWKNADADLNILCLHQAIDGASVGPKNYIFRNQPDVIDINDISAEFALVLCGHIHRRQILNSQKGTPVVFAGSVERTSFAEKEEPKGFYDINFKSISGPPGISFIKLPTRPMIDINANSSFTEGGLYESFRERVAKLPSNAIIRIDLDDTISIDELRKLIPDSIILYQRRTNFI